MTPEEMYRYLQRYYIVATYDAEFYWYLLRAFQGKAGQDTFSSQPNGAR